MTATIHRAIVAISSAITAISVLWSQTDPVGLGLSTETAAWIAFVLAMLSAVATAVRQATAP